MEPLRRPDGVYLLAYEVDAEVLGVGCELVHVVVGLVGGEVSVDDAVDEVCAYGRHLCREPVVVVVAYVCEPRPVVGVVDDVDAVA